MDLGDLIYMANRATVSACRRQRWRKTPDLQQEVATRCWQVWVTQQEMTRALAYRIAMNMVADAIRKHLGADGSKAEKTAMLAYQQRGEIELGEWSEVRDRELCEHLDHIYNNLDEDLQEPFCLMRAGHTVSSIARHMGMTRDRARGIVDVMIRSARRIANG